MNIASVKWLAGVALLAGALASCSKDTVEATRMRIGKCVTLTISIR